MVGLRLVAAERIPRAALLARLLGIGLLLAGSVEGGRR
jgi:hypothetical protein